MASAQRTLVLKTYLNVLRAIGFAFRGDSATIQQARLTARQTFESQEQELGPTQQRIEHAQGVVKILYENVVQGSKDASAADSPYKLNIHERTERGDNETIKKLGGTGKSFASLKS